MSRATFKFTQNNIGEQTTFTPAEIDEFTSIIYDKIFSKVRLFCAVSLDLEEGQLRISIAKTHSIHLLATSFGVRVFAFVPPTINAT